MNVIKGRLYNEYHTFIVGSFLFAYKIFNNKVLKKLCTFLCKYPEYLDILKDPVFVRLDSIYQEGMTHYISDELYPQKNNITRYNHSITCSIIIWYICKYNEKKYGNIINDNFTIKLMIIALLHDISHVALSHVIDRVWHEYHAENRKNFIMHHKSLMEILYNLENRGIINIERDILVEFNDFIKGGGKTRLNIDRLAYFLHDWFFAKYFNLKKDTTQVIKFIFNALNSVRLFVGFHNNEPLNELVFTDMTIAERFSEISCKMNKLWTGSISTITYVIAGKIIEALLNQNLLTEKELYVLTDDELIELMKKYYLEEYDKIVNGVNGSFDLIQYNIVIPGKKYSDHDKENVTYTFDELQKKHKYIGEQSRYRLSQPYVWKDDINELHQLNTINMKTITPVCFGLD